MVTLGSLREIILVTITIEKNALRMLVWIRVTSFLAFWESVNHLIPLVRRESESEMCSLSTLELVSVLIALTLEIVILTSCLIIIL